MLASSGPHDLMKQFQLNPGWTDDLVGEGLDQGVLSVDDLNSDEEGAQPLATLPAPVPA